MCYVSFFALNLDCFWLSYLYMSWSSTIFIIIPFCWFFFFFCSSKYSTWMHTHYTQSLTTIPGHPCGKGDALPLNHLWVGYCWIHWCSWLSCNYVILISFFRIMLKSWCLSYNSADGFEISVSSGGNGCNWLVFFFFAVYIDNYVI